MTRAVLCTPMRIEQAAVRPARRGMRVVRTGMGPRRAAATAATLPDGPLVIAGIGGGLAPQVRPGDMVVADEVRGPGTSVQVPSAPLLAGALRRLGLTVHMGPIVSTDRVVTGRDRLELARGGALAVDMESSLLARPGTPLAIVRSIVDTADHPLLRPGTIGRGVTSLRGLRATVPVLEQWAAATGPRAVLLAGPRSCDAPYPQVTKVHNKFRRQTGRGDTVVQIGDAKHEEVAGTVGKAPENVVVVDDVAADICYATTNRRCVLRAVAGAVDLMLVAGSGNAADSRRFAEITEREGVQAHPVGDSTEVDLAWLAGVDRIGITAGASAHPHLIEEVVRCLSGLGPLTISESRLMDGNVTFTLPREGL
jgi:hypothetical protein